MDSSPTRHCRQVLALQLRQAQMASPVLRILRTAPRNPETGTLRDSVSEDLERLA